MKTEIYQLLSVIVVAIGAIAAAISAYHSSKSSKITLELFKKEKLEKLNDDLNRILELGIQYPYLESKTFTQKWNDFKSTEDERYLRYDIYCNFIFNYLQNVWLHFEQDKTKVEDFVDIKTWIRIHKQNWLSPIDDNENIDGYSVEFRQFINSYLI
jgi:hypothetical protein